MSQERYDKAAPQSISDADCILDYARLLLGQSMRALHPNAKLSDTGRGSLGLCVEREHFGIEQNSDSEPDFKKAKVELKSTPLKKLKEGSFVSKERLVLNIINYVDEAKKSFKTSSFTSKNATLLLLFYLYDKEVEPLDSPFKIIRLWRLIGLSKDIPEEDYRIIENDWKIIHDKIVSNKADQISEADTLYLAACTKGSKSGAEMPLQPNGTRAQQRAFSIKSSYLNFVILDSMLHPEMCDMMRMTDRKRKAIINKIEKARKEHGHITRSERDGNCSFQDLVLMRFRAYFGKTIAEIAKMCLAKISPNSKSTAYQICRAILGVKEARITEFEKANLQLKTVRLESNGKLKESMSFPAIKYTEIVKEEWNESEWYHQIAAQPFLFIVFEKVKGGSAVDAKLKDAFFWSMPCEDIDKAEELWNETREKICEGDYSHFRGISKSKDKGQICHVRPHGRDATDLADTPQGGKAKKYSFWLNREYVLNIVNSHLQSH